MSFLKFLYKKICKSFRSVSDQSEPIEISDVPDSPQSFGYKSCWLAIKTERAEKIIDVFNELNFLNAGYANWETGMKAAWNSGHNSLFVSPSIDGWTFVFGFALDDFGFTCSPDKNKKAIKKFIEFGQIFGRKDLDFFYFYSYRVSDGYFWAAIENGVIKRAVVCYQDEI